VDAQRWQRTKELFEAVYELGPAARQALLDAECGDDLRMRAEIESLIKSYESVPAALELPAFRPLTSLIRVKTSEDLVGRRIGAYRLDHLIACGGMGSVYQASRADGQFEQTVAIKLIDRGWVGQNAARVVRNELAALARLDHPHIARLLDGGVAEDGIAYLVMEFVDGLPIDVYCDRKRLPVAERLRLFHTICGTVHHAHQRLIVHRDLKPGNVMVTREGVPKLLDFGIAEILDSDAPAQSNEPRTIQRVMTPEYASPEQIRGEAVTTASDIYSLGVLLFQLLTGQRPYRLTSRLPAEISRIICGSEPPRPSTIMRRRKEVSGGEGTDVGEDRSFAPPAGRLSREIDAVVLKALRKDPGERYASAEQFGEDIQRHLAGLPVSARTSSLAYRGMKLLARHQTTAKVAAVAVLISLLIGAIGIVRQARIAARQRDFALAASKAARREAESAMVEVRKSERVTAFLRDLLTEADPRGAKRDITLREVLQEAAGQVQVRFGDDSEVESAIQTAVGQTYLGLGDYEEAEQHLRRALTIQQDIHQGDHSDVGRSLRNLGVALYSKGAFDEAHDLCHDALAMHLRIYGVEHAEVAQDLNDLAAIHRQRGQLDDARQYLLEALRIRRGALGGDGIALAETLTNLAGVYLANRDLAAAEPLAREALSIRRRLLPSYHPDVAQSIDNLAVILASAGNYTEAEALHQEAYGLYQASLGENHPEVATAQMNLAGVLYMQGKPGDAANHARQALANRRRSLPEGDPRTAYSEQVLGLCLAALKKYEEAEGLLLHSYDSTRTAFGATHSRTMTSLRRIVDLYESWNKPELAAEYRATLETLSAAAEATD
jgi:serine/threonine-protein kinase